MANHVYPHCQQLPDTVNSRLRSGPSNPCLRKYYNGFVVLMKKKYVKNELDWDYEYGCVYLSMKPTSRKHPIILEWKPPQNKALLMHTTTPNVGQRSSSLNTRLS